MQCVNKRSLISIFSVLVASLIGVSTSNGATTEPSASALAEIDAYLEKYYARSADEASFLDDAGRKVNCVRVDAQPALANPLLRDHKIQLLPSPAAQAALGNKVKMYNKPSKCLNGTIEMRLPAREEIVRAGSLRQYFAKYPSTSDTTSSTTRGRVAPLSVNTPTRWYAVARKFTNLIGAQSTVNIWQPFAFLTEFSLSQIWVYAGSTPLQTVEAGSQVYPLHYRNSGANFFIYYTSNSYLPNTGCYNLDCPAFVQTSSVLPIGGLLTPSVTGGFQSEGTIAYYRDPATGHWWLYYFDGTTYWPSGYYANTLFGTGPMSVNAQAFDVGGEVYDSGNVVTTTTTDMGSGAYANAGAGYAAYHRNVKYMLVNQTILDFAHDALQATNPGCYSMVLGTNPAWGYSIFFGGPGGNNAPACP